MTKRELLEYIGAVCDAENAIYACDEAIASLEEQVKKIPPVGYPPCLYEPDMEFRYNVWYLEDEPKRGDYLFPWQYKKALNEFLMGRRLAEQELAEYEKKKLEIKQWYEKEMPIYIRKVQINLKTDRLLKQEIEKCSSLRSQISAKLNQLYAMNIIHINFRNIIALNQLREYLEMGICDTLEGPYGAYAQYLMDIRTERICSSIQDLKESLVDALNKFSATQGALLQELRATHSAISKMEQSISSGLVNLGASMIEAQFASGNRIEACLSDATAQIGKIEKSISTASYNQYIALRHTNIDNYLLRHPSV